MKSCHLCLKMWQFPTKNRPVDTLPHLVHPKNHWKTTRRWIYECVFMDHRGRRILKAALLGIPAASLCFFTSLPLSHTITPNNDIIAQVQSFSCCSLWANQPPLSALNLTALMSSCLVPLPPHLHYQPPASRLQGVPAYHCWDSTLLWCFITHVQ